MIIASLHFSSPASAAVFSDVSSNHPNFDAINYLYDNGVIEGYEDNTFRPAKLVNRVEALKIILLGSNVLVPNIQEQEIFPDVMSDAWYGKFVAKAKNLGIVSGDGDTGLFRPGDTVNLAEGLKILLKTGSKESLSPSSNPYWDVDMNAWFAPYFEYARQAHLLDQSKAENVYPATPVTRGLLAELMYRLANSNLIVPDGEASYYGEKFHGKTTANGEIFDASGYTAAHRTLPFNTRLRVTNAENGKSIVVRINDRGPYAGENRIIDLSKAAFEVISPLSRGIISVKIEQTQDPVYTPPADIEEAAPATTTEETGDPLNPTKINCPEGALVSTISKTTFQNITLESDIPDRFLVDEILTLKGSTSSNTDVVSAFLVDENSKQTSFRASVSGGQFSIFIRFPKIGDYKLGVIPGEEGQSIVKDIIALKNTCIEEVETDNLPAISGVEMDIEEGGTKIFWEPGDFNLFKVTFTQGGLHRSYILHDMAYLKPVYSEFYDFQNGDVNLSIRGGNLTKNSILEPAQILWSPATEKTFLARTHHEYEVNETEVELVSLAKNSIQGATIQAIFKPKVSIRKKAAIILPSGKVQEVDLTSSGSTAQNNQFDIEVFPASGASLNFNYKALTTGVHFLEVNNAEGLAVINVPIYVKNQFPLLPNVRDLATQTSVDLGSDIAALRNQFLSLVNADRSSYNLSELKLNDNLSRLAQYRSDDMVANKYFGHWNQSGQDANDLRLNYGIQTLVGENLAKDINLELAEYGLMQSAIHRSNILSDEWTRVGFGISQLPDGSYDFVQIFSSEPLNMDDMGSLRNSVLNAANENRGANLNLQDNLNSVAQNWSVKMVAEDFFDFVSSGGDSLVDAIRDAGINAALGTYIMGNSSFADALAQLTENAQLQQTNWKNLGVGIKQDNLGIIKITLIYTE